MKIPLMTSRRAVTWDSRKAAAIQPTLQLQAAMSRPAEEVEDCSAAPAAGWAVKQSVEQAAGLSVEQAVGLQAEQAAEQAAGQAAGQELPIMKMKTTMNFTMNTIAFRLNPAPVGRTTKRRVRALMTQKTSTASISPITDITNSSRNMQTRLQRRCATTAAALILSCLELLGLGRTRYPAALCKWQRRPR